MEEWQAKRGSSSSGAPRLTTGFLDGTHPIVDAYELKVPALPAFSRTHTPAARHWSELLDTLSKTKSAPAADQFF